MVPLLRAEGSEEESQVGLVVPEDVCPLALEAETMFLPRTPDEALVVDVVRGLDSGSMIEQAHRILMQVSFFAVLGQYTPWGPWVLGPPQLGVVADGNSTMGR